jgi:hypothetical protein
MAIQKWTDSRIRKIGHRKNIAKSGSNKSKFKRSNKDLEAMKELKALGIDMVEWR